MTHLTKFITESKQRCEAATEGPWSNLSEPGEVHSCVMSDSTGDPFHVAEHVPRTEDEVFICQARTDLPLALSIIERLVAAIQGPINYYSTSLPVDIDPDEPECCIYRAMVKALAEVERMVEERK